MQCCSISSSCAESCSFLRFVVQYCALFCVSPGSKSCSFLRFVVHQTVLFSAFLRAPKAVLFSAFRRLSISSFAHNCALFCGVSPCTFASSPKKIYKELLYVIKEQKVALLLQASVIFCKILRAPNGALNHATVIQAMGHGPQLYAQTLLHRHFTPRHFYMQLLLHRCLYTQPLLHTDTFTHSRFYTPTLLHKDAFTQTLLHRRFCTQTLSHAQLSYYAWEPALKLHRPQHNNTFSSQCPIMLGNPLRDLGFRSIKNIFIKFLLPKCCIMLGSPEIGNSKSQCFLSFLTIEPHFGSRRATQNPNFSSQFLTSETVAF